MVSASHSLPLLRRAKRTRALGREQSPSIVTRWLAGQDVATGPISSNQPAIQLPFQRWFKFKEAFSPQFIVECAESLGKPARSCLDPFGGSGTSALTAQFLGIRPTTIEVNPFLADLIEAKLSSYDVSSLRTDYLEVLRVSKDLSPATAKLLKDAPATLVNPGVDDRWIYSKGIARRILALREAIALVKSRPNRLLLTVVLGSILVSLSNVIVNGKVKLLWRSPTPATARPASHGVAALGPKVEASEDASPPQVSPLNLTTLPDPPPPLTPPVR